MVEKIITPEITNHQPTYIWVLGLFGAGKTYVRKQLEAVYPDAYVTSDGKHLFEVAASDPNHTIHEGYGMNFYTTETDFHVRMAARLFRELKQVDNKICLIEKATGIGKDAAPTSLAQFTQMMPPEIFNRSIFYYVYAPFNVRTRRNDQRNGDNHGLRDGIHTPSIPFQRSMWGDDFQEWRKTIVRPLKVVNNY